MATTEAEHNEDGPSAPKNRKMTVKNIHLTKSQLPSVIDGFKLDQRKVIYTCTYINSMRERNVEQLASLVIYYSSYLHDKESLCTTIVNMSHNYVGSNNINLLKCKDPVGSRLEEKKEFDSPHILMKISPIALLLFHPDDDKFIKHEYDGDQRIQPVHYLPIIPMVLVNGEDCESSKIPSYNPRDIVKNIMRMLDDEEPLPMLPWYKNFKGTVQLLQDKYIISGEATILPNDTIEITELPIGVWAIPYKSNVLHRMLGNDGVKATISEFEDHSTDSSIRFVVKLLPDKLPKIKKEGVNKVFQLQRTVTLNCMNALDENGCVRKYDSVEEILREFYGVRMKYYVKRKAYVLGRFHAEIESISNQARFIIEKCDGDITIENKQRNVVVEELKKRGYGPDPVKKWKKDIQKQLNIPKSEDESSSDEEEEDSSDSDKDNEVVKMYNYLLGMSASMLTEGKIEKLLKKRDRKMEEMNILRSKTPSDLWREDLEAFINKLDEVEENEKNAT